MLLEIFLMYFTHLNVFFYQNDYFYKKKIILLIIDYLCFDTCDCVVLYEKSNKKYY